MYAKFESIRRQLRANKDANLLYPAASRSLAIDRHFRDMLQEARAKRIAQEEVDRLVDFAVRECIRSILRLNQYLSIGDTYRKRLADIYRRTWTLLQDDNDVDTVLRTEHHPAIQAWISELYPPTLLKTLARQQAIRAVTCSEYSAELQLNVLQIDIEDIRGPVLDIGCGFTAPLVQYLLSRHIDAFGFDRIVAQETPSVREADWFTYDFSERSWGTIISHMAFSNHYRYALHHDPKLKKEMESVFTRILMSLAPGGCFVYAPGSDELDSLIDNRTYTVETSAILSSFTLKRVRRVSAD